MSYLFPTPTLQAGEDIKRKIRAQVSPPDDKSTTGYLYLTNRRVIYLASRGTPKSRQRVLEFNRDECAGVERDHTRWGVGPGSGAWQLLWIHLHDRPSVRFLMRNADENARYLSQELSGPDAGAAE